MVVPESCISSLHNSKDHLKKTNIREDFAMFDVSNLKNVEPPSVIRVRGFAFQRDQETSAQWTKETDADASTEEYGEPGDYLWTCCQRSAVP